MWAKIIKVKQASGKIFKCFYKRALPKANVSNFNRNQVVVGHDVIANVLSEFVT